MLLTALLCYPVVQLPKFRFYDNNEAVQFINEFLLRRRQRAGQLYRTATVHERDGARLAASAGVPVRLRGAFRIGLSYSYTLHKDAALADYNMEAQGDLLADYFVLKFLRKPGAMRQQRYRDSLALFEQVLAGFLRDPGDRANLHRGPARWLALSWTIKPQPR